MKQLTIVIPNKEGQTPEDTICSLYQQTFTDFDIIIINDKEGNANVARNKGLAKVTSPYVLFSDNDINWYPYAIAEMVHQLDAYPSIAFAWGAYELSGKIWCNHEWDPALLRRKNYISTMTMVRTVLHPGFDPQIKRLQDWDVWLTMLEMGLTGKYVGRILFETALRRGITTNSISLEEARKTITQKHKL